MVPHKYNDIRDLSEIARQVYEYEKMPLKELFSILEEKISGYIKGDRKRIKKAYEVGKKYHAGQKRKSGAPYFTHPLIVAILLSDHQPDEDMIIATLLHDVVEDTEATMDDMAVFGEDVVAMIDALTKIYQEHVAGEHQSDNLKAKLETIRKILRAGEIDMRVLIIKIFDRLHNILTIYWKSNPFSRDRYLQQTLEIYVPIAKRIGLRGIYHEFLFHINYYLRSQRFHRIAKILEAKEKRMEIVAKTIQEYITKLGSKNIQSVQFHRRNVFSLNRRPDPNDLTLDDMFFVEIVVKSKDDCYNLLEDLNNPIDSTLIPVGIVRDFISKPKLSRYRALQLEAVINGQQKVRVHILSKEMYERRVSLLRVDELTQIYSDVLFADFDLIDEATASNSDKFIESVTHHVFAKKMQIHNPEMQEVFVPYEFTALDAAIYLYPDKIMYIDKVRVNKKSAYFGDQVKINDIVEVIFSKQPRAVADWLRYLQSDISRYRLQEVLKKDNTDLTLERGKEILQNHFDTFHMGDVGTLLHREAPKKLNMTMEEVYRMIGQGLLLPLEVMEKLGKTKRSLHIRVAKKVLGFFRIIPKTLEDHVPYLRFSFQSTEISASKLIKEVQAICDDFSVIIESLKCHKWQHGYQFVIKITSQDKRNLFAAITKMSSAHHILDVHIHLKRRFKLRILGLFLFVIGGWLLFFSLIPWFASTDGLRHLIYLSVAPPLIVNIALYRFCIYYFSSWRHNKLLLLFVTLINFVAISMFSWYVFTQGLDILNLSFFFPLIVGIVSIVLTIILFYRGNNPTPALNQQYEMNTKTKINGYLIRLGAVIVWGIQPILFRYLIDPSVGTSTRMPVMFLGMFLFAIVLTGLFWAFTKRKGSIEWRFPINIHFWLISGGLIALYFLITESLGHTTSTNFILLNNFAPVFTLVIALILWQSQYPYLRKAKYIKQIFTVFLIGGIGSTLLFYNDIRSDVTGNIHGNTIALLAMVADIFITLGQIRYVNSLSRRHLTPAIIMVISAGAFILTLPLLLMAPSEVFQMHLLMPVLITGMVVTLGIILNIEAFKRIDGFIAHLMFNISILITFFLEAFLLNKIIPSGLIIASMVLIISASFLAEMISTRAQKDTLATT